jgi:hypothetical protein
LTNAGLTSEGKTPAATGATKVASGSRETPRQKVSIINQSSIKHHQSSFNHQ